MRYGADWSEAEDAILREHYTDGGWLSVRQYLPHRSRGAVSKRANHIGVSRSLYSHPYLYPIMRSQEGSGPIERFSRQHYDEMNNAFCKAMIEAGYAKS
jgi:hypothetical protein